MQLYPEADPEVAVAAVEEELQTDEWNLSELERIQQEQVGFQGIAYDLTGDNFPCLDAALELVSNTVEV